jgi:hypothetical protein
VGSVIASLLGRYTSNVFGTLNAIALVVILGIISIAALLLVVKLSRSGDGRSSPGR